MTPQFLVALVAVCMITSTVIVVTAYVRTQGTDKLPSQAIRFLMTLLLASLLFFGWPPARWITIVLLGISAVVSIPVGIRLRRISKSGTGLTVLGLVYAACVVALLTSTAEEHFSGAAMSE